MRSHLGALGADLRLALAQSALMISFLAHQAWLMGDAIARTLTRLFVTRRHLLEWVPAAQAAIGPRLDLFGFYRRMAGAVVIAAVAVIVASAWGHGTWPLALPFAALWIASPAIARWTSRSPVVAGRLSMSDGDARALRLIARRTWRFFETFVTPADQMLPPDNFQEDPAPVLAHRTSPTNLGLYLLSVVSARDFGWTGTIDAVERLEATLSTMSRLARFRGHFYNWYDTRDLRPLDPQYISSVDSGNLAGHLIALANACREWAAQPLTDERRLAGIADALELMREEAGQLREGRANANGDVAPAGRGARRAGGQPATDTRRRRGDRQTSLDARGRRRDPGGHRPCARDRTKRRHRRRHAVLGGGDPKRDREPPP